MTARCRCTIPATSSTTRSCRSVPACSPVSSKPVCRQVPMHKPAAEEEITSLHDLSAVDLIAGYRAKQFSPSEVLEEVIEHVAAWEPHIKALYLFDPDSARAAAKASTDRWQKGEPTGTLDGIPVTIKDNMATKGQPVPLGAASVRLVRPGRAEAEFWARSDRSALCRPRGGADDPHRRRCGTDDVRIVEAGSPRRHEPAGGRQHSLEGARQVAAQGSHRPDARSRRRP